MDYSASQSLQDIAAALGVTWKRSRKRLPASSKAKFVELLLDLRSHILPKEELSIEENLQRARPDIRLLVGFLAKLATRGSLQSEELNEEAHVVWQGGKARWCDLVDEEEKGEDHCVIGESAGGRAEKEERGTQTECFDQRGGGEVRVVECAIQTMVNMTNTEVVIGPSGLLEVVEQSACRCLLLELQRSVPLFSGEYDCVMDDYTSLEVSEACGELESGLGILLGEFGEQVRRGMGMVYDMQKGRVSDLAKLSDLLDEVLKVDSCACGDPQQEVARSGLLCSPEPSVGCELRDLREIRDRIGELMRSMHDAASELLPGTRSVGSECLSFGPFRLRQGPVGSRLLVMEASPEWTCTPPTVLERAAAIRSAPPVYLAGLEEQELGEYDILLNEIFARPSCKASYIANLQEVQCLCGEQVDQVCDLLNVPMQWQELKRAIIAKVMQLDGEFSLFDVIAEIGSEM